MTLRSVPSRIRLLVPALVALGVVTSARQSAPPPLPDRTEALSRALAGGTARNVLLFIGDGMGDSEITLARNYALGARGRLAMDTLALSGTYTTFSISDTDPSKPDYVPDSAATGTAWATGEKTSNGRISTSAATDRDLKTILEYAQDLGYRTGDISTADLTDATPAVLGAHVASRTCMGPADMAKCPQDRKRSGGPGSIAEQLIDHGIDLLFGGGAARFEQATDDGPTVLQRAVLHGYRIITSGTGLDYVGPGQRVLALFGPGNLPTEWNGAEALPYPSNVKAPQVCEQNQRPAWQPSLADLTLKAIQLLENTSPSGPGFFLQVEGASIDKQNHAANPCAQIGETIAFDRAIAIGLEFARRHPDTLIVVTADHGHSSQIVSMPTDDDHPVGLLSVLMTADKAPMAVAYATNGYHRSQDHTGTQVRIAAEGPHAAGVLGVIDQTDLFRLLMRAMRTSQ